MITEANKRHKEEYHLRSPNKHEHILIQVETNKRTGKTIPRSDLRPTWDGRECTGTRKTIPGSTSHDEIIQKLKSKNSNRKRETQKELHNNGRPIRKRKGSRNGTTMDTKKPI